MSADRPQRLETASTAVYRRGVQLPTACGLERPLSAEGSGHGSNSSGGAGGGGSRIGNAVEQDMLAGAGIARGVDIAMAGGMQVRSLADGAEADHRAERLGRIHRRNQPGRDQVGPL